MRTEDVNEKNNSETEHSEVPWWCVKKTSLLSREEIEAIVHMHDDSTDIKKEGNNEKTTRQAPTVTSDGSHERSSLKSRIAWLPMFLQTEALVLRRYQQQHRQHMKELIELSECIAMVCDGTLRSQSPVTISHGAEDPLKARHTEDEALRRMLCRAEELEGCVRAAAVNSVRCTQRMVLAAAVAMQKSRTMRKTTRSDDGIAEVRRRRI